MTERKRLSDILSEGQRKSYFANWSTVRAAGGPTIPRGEYVARLVDGFAHKAQTGTMGFKLVFEIAEGEHQDRKLFHDLWLTEAAKPQTKRDLDELGITDPEHQLDGPIPQGIVVALTVTVHKDDDRIEKNRIRRIRFLRVEPGDAFEPKDDADQAGAEPFPFGVNCPTGEGAPPSTTVEPPPDTNGTPDKPKRKRKRKDASDATGTEGGTAP
jgi:hypothetical protein